MLRNQEGMRLIRYFIRQIESICQAHTIVNSEIQNNFLFSVFSVPTAFTIFGFAGPVGAFAPNTSDADQTQLEVHTVLPAIITLYASRL